MISYLNNTLHEDTIKIYIYLGIKWQESQEKEVECQFSVKELAAYFGLVEGKVSDILRILM